MEKVAVGVDDVGLAEFCLDEGHDVGQIGLAYVLSVRNLHRRSGATTREMRRITPTT